MVLMGYLMKEVLKTLCGVNQWSYAVFWKIGCQNPKLLIWEECYYGSASCSRNGNLDFAFQGYNSSSASAEMLNLQSGVRAGDKVHLLVSKIMMDNHVNIVGEGLVGRVAFTGNHQWILSENYHKESHPPEVSKEICQQFSAGMQIAESMGFANDVVSLVLHLACVPGFLQSNNYAAKELAPKFEVPTCSGYSAPADLPFEPDMINGSSFVIDGFNYVGCSSQTSVFDSKKLHSLAREIQNERQSSVAAFQDPRSSPCHLKPQDWHEEPKTAQAAKLDCSFANQFMNGVAKDEVIPSNSDVWMNQHSSLYSSLSVKKLSSSSSFTLNHGSARCIQQNIMSDNGNRGHLMNPLSSDIPIFALQTSSGFISSSFEGSYGPSVEANGLCHGASSNMKQMTNIDSLSDGSKHPTLRGYTNLNSSEMESILSDSVNCLTANSLLSYCSGSKSCLMDNNFVQSELNPAMEGIEQNTMHAQNVPLTRHDEHLKIEDNGKPKIEGQIHPVDNTNYDDAFVQPQSGDDLFDILGADFKNKFLSSYWSSFLSKEKNNSPSRKGLAAPEIYSTSQGNSDSGIFSLSGTGQLLDAVVSKVHPSYNQSLDDNISCRTTLTDSGSSSVPKFSCHYGQLPVSDHVKGKLLGIPKYLAKAGAMSSSLLKTVSTKEDSGTYSQSSCVYDSWIGNMKQNNSVATGYANKLNEKSKTNHKRLKPGENPRPRPKDRQMIQDRVKELREIVPNGAKCSIDALLERTIKHMLFLQSVTKHADKLKQTAQSKIVGKDGGLLMKENFGGATWAYEIGSQSLVCPIVVEDLNQPRQMLVEMLCEERGSFLEIADVIRGMGLTILKGLMETRNDKIWARFAVEANGDVTRMEIFLSLVHLSKQNAKSTVPQPNDISNENTLIQEFHQAAFVPVTGRSCCLQ